MDDDRGINLMPDDLKPKKSGKNKQAKKRSFEPDLVIPGKQGKTKSGQRSGGSVPIWDRVSDIVADKFTAKKRAHGSFGARHNKEPNKKKSDSVGPQDTETSLPKIETTVPIVYDDAKPTQRSKDKSFSISEAKAKPSGGRTSFFSKLGSIFASKAKKPNGKKDVSILGKEIKTNGSAKLTKKSDKKDKQQKPDVHIIKSGEDKKLSVADAMSIPKPDIKEPVKITLDTGIEKAKVGDSVVVDMFAQDESEPAVSMGAVKKPVDSSDIKQEARPKLHIEDRIPVAEPEPSPKPQEEVKPDFSIPQSITPEPTEKSEQAAVPAAKPKKKSEFHRPKPRIRAKFVDSEGGVDLIPTAARTRSWRQLSTLMIVSLVGSIVVVGIFYGALFIKKQEIIRQQELKNQEISDLEREILDFEDINKEIQSLGEEIKQIDKILNDHVYWTNFFSLLEKYTVEDVFYRGFAAGDDGALTLSAVARDYDAVARQLKILQQEDAQEFAVLANVNSASQTNEGVEFSITFVLDPFLFLYNDQSTE